MKRREFLGVLGAGATLAGRGRAWSPPDRAELILHNGVIHTIDATFRTTSALAIAAGRVIGAGTDAAMRRLAGPKTEVIDLAGQSVIPGINDAHFHAAVWGLARPPFSVDVGYPAVKSIADVAELIRQTAATKKPGEWIHGRGWDQPYFAERRAPTRQDLDRVSPDNPVILDEFSGHATWVNSKALELAGITRETVPPPSGVIVKDAAGEPTGLLFEVAGGLVRRKMPAPSGEERAQALAIAGRWMLENGITSYTEPGIDPGMIAIMAERSRQRGINPRTTVLVGAGRSTASVKAALAAYQGVSAADQEWLNVVGVKFYADGIPTNNKTAWVHEPYLSGGTGSLVIEGNSDEERVAELRAMIRLAHEAGLQIGTHATGDRAIDAVVDGYVAAMDAAPRPDPRHYVIHSDLVSPKTLAKMARYGIGANFNASIKHLIADGQLETIGPERAPYEWPYKTALDSGVKVSSGSDAPVTDGNWRQGLATCLLRKGKQSGKVSGPDQRITLNQALWTYTVGGAWQDRADRWKGSLETRKAADLCVLDGPIGTMAPDDYLKLRVTMTLVGGKVAFQTG